jgi:hypothetical protein
MSQQAIVFGFLKLAWLKIELGEWFYFIFGGETEVFGRTDVGHNVK